jgi:5-methylcytosine-specific restriction protein A
LRNPKWHRDEIILALDLYFKLEPGQISARNPAIIELSKVLNKLPIHEERPDSVKFRNPNGVGLKLSNFLAIDQTYDGKGMQSYSKLDKLVFEGFENQKQRLALLANNIKEAVLNESLNNKLYAIGEETDDTLAMVKEGMVIYRLHKYYERNPKINKQKKSLHLKKYGQLDCEACDFNFHRTYGDLGKGYIECHHTTPLYQIGAESITTLNDLALVCSNCHRMIHREIDTVSIKSLRESIFKE